MHAPEETIAALATPPGEGALAVVRVSGPEALDVLRALAGSEDGAGRRPRPRRLIHLRLATAEGRPLDEVLAVWMPGPRSYTGEDVVEIYAHGGQASVRAILGELFQLGVKAALPGEFTYRALLAGRLDLIQAEAVAELIRSGSERARELNLQQLEGSLSRRLSALSARLRALLRDLEAGIDFAEEDIEFVSREELGRGLALLRDELARVLAGADAGRLIREGVDVVLAGEPNVGKSSLFNRLLEADRAIVTTQPGTTRDLLTESWGYGGLVFRLHDTAGLREAGDEAERQGVQKTEAALRRAEIVLWVLDASRPATASEAKRLAALERDRHLVLVNKIDLGGADPARAAGLLPEGMEALPVSALDGRGLDRLREAIFALAIGPRGTGSLMLDAAVNRRQEASLREVQRCLEGLDECAVAGLEVELLAGRLREALAGLDELQGSGVGDEVLSEIFARFCVGK